LEYTPQPWIGSTGKRSWILEYPTTMVWFDWEEILDLGIYPTTMDWFDWEEILDLGIYPATMDWLDWEEFRYTVASIY